MPTKIEWTDETWNPVTGCTRVSEGCRNCYAARLASGRLRNHPRYQGLSVKGNWTGAVRLHPEMLEEPLHWRKPRMCFVCSMSDLFHDDVPIDFIAGVWDTMASATLTCNKRHDHDDPDCWQGDSHTFQVLTKRPERMLSMLSDEMPNHVAEQWPGDCPLCVALEVDWPLRNVWLGVTVENRDNDWRIPILLQTPAAVRFVSAEPLLGPTNLDANLLLEYLDQVIVGAETGPGARYMDPDWARDIRDQCKAAGVPFFMKQMSNKEPIPEDLMIREYPDGA